MTLSSDTLQNFPTYQSFTVPPNTLQGSPLQAELAFSVGMWDNLEVVIPAGHSGQTGLQVVWQDKQIVPFNDGAWLVADDDRITFPLGMYSAYPNLVVYGYNVGIYEHTFFLRLSVRGAIPGGSNSVPVDQLGIYA